MLTGKARGLTAAGWPPVPILMYHQVAASRAEAGRLAVSAGQLAEQLERLAAGGFRTMTARDVAAEFAAGAVPVKTVVLTFDDGFADFHSRALPLLLRFGFTATLFVTTGWITGPGGRAAGAPGRMLTREQLAEAADAGIEVGAHTHGHPALDSLTAAGVRRELAESRSRLEDWLGRPVPGAAYPFGYWNGQVRRAAAAAGHRYACAVGNQLADLGAHPHSLPRLTMSRSTSMASFEDIIRGQRVPAHYRADHALTRGWAVARGGRRAAGQILSRCTGR